MPTLRQEQFLKRLPENGFNMAKTMREVGYTDATSDSGTQYRTLRKITAKLDFFDPERIKKDIEYTLRLAKKKKDLTNLARINEHRSKIAGMITDKSEVNNKNPEKTIVVYGNKQENDGNQKLVSR